MEVIIIIKTDLLYFGNKLSLHGATPTGVETLGSKLSEFTNIITASNKKNKFIRLIDMIFILFENKRKINYVLIDTYSGNAFYFAFIISIFSRLLKINYIPILRGGDLTEVIKNKKYISNNIFLNSTINIAPSSFLRDSFKIQNYDSIIIPNFIELKLYPFKLREECRPKLLWVRSFHKIYNPKMAILVLNELLQDFPEAELCMIGPIKDSSYEDCLKLSELLRIKNKINFTGLLDKKDWVKMSREYDIFLNTTNFDNLPVSILEVMALGFPIVTTNAGGLLNFHEDNIDALMVKKNDVKSMSKKVKRIILDSKLAKNLSLNARSKSELYSWSNLRKQWEKLFLELK